MSGVRVSILEKKTSSGGLALIRIEGVSDWPENARIVIEPLDAMVAAGERTAWPARDLAPLTVSRDESTVELLIGPDIVDAPALMPGTPVLVSIPQARISAEIAWPRLMPSRFRRWAPVAMTAEQMQKIIAEQRAEATVRVARTIAEANRQEQESAERLGASKAAGDATASAAAATTRTAQPGMPFGLGNVPLGSDWRGNLAAFATGAVVAALTTLAVWSVSSAPSGSARAPEGQAAAQVAPIVLPDDVFTASPVSPRRRSAGGVDIAEAMRLADFSLRGSAGVRDEVEGGFWLKHALVGTMRDPQLRWALTQLGTVYAAPADGLPDYARARALWEVATLLGDGTAMCFLGHLHRHGLGTPVSTETARLYYNHSKVPADCQRR